MRFRTVGLNSFFEQSNMETDYAEVVTRRPVQRFLLKVLLSDISIQTLILVSPFVGTLEGTTVTLDGLCRNMQLKGINTYVITRASEEEHQKRAIDTLKGYDAVELRFNQSLHAKLYVCLCNDEAQSFALLGSANLTRNSINKNIEIGMMIYGRGRGRDILVELSRWGLERLRTLNDTKLVKRIERS